MDDQVFSINWNAHHKKLLSVFKDLLQTETLVDCTLSAEGKFIKAHKVIISACSPYLKMLLSQHAAEVHPILILGNTNFSDLQNLVHYMYTGNVEIHKNEMVKFVQTAECLSVSGLLKEDDESTQKMGTSLSETSIQDENEHERVQETVGGIIRGRSGEGSSKKDSPRRKRARLISDDLHPSDKDHSTGFSSVVDDFEEENWEPQPGTSNDHTLEQSFLDERHIDHSEKYGSRPLNPSCGGEHVTSLPPLRSPQATPTRDVNAPEIQILNI